MLLYFLLCFAVKIDFVLESVAMLHLFFGSIKFFFLKSQNCPFYGAKFPYNYGTLIR